MAAGHERAVAATKTYTAELLALLLLIEGIRAGDGALPDEVREERRARFMELAEELSAKRMKKKVGKTVKVLSARLSEQKGSTPGAVIESKGKLVVACGDGGGLELLTVQPQGKKAMDAKAFLAGHPLAVGTILGA